MSEFKVGDKVIVWDLEDMSQPVRERYESKTGTVTQVGGYFGYQVSFEDGLGVYSFRERELILAPAPVEPEDFEAKYNALVAGVIAAWEAGNLYPFADALAREQEPKPKMYDVTVRVDGAGAEDATRGGALFGRPVVSVKEVTE